MGINDGDEGLDLAIPYGHNLYKSVSATFDSLALSNVCMRFNSGTSVGIDRLASFKTVFMLGINVFNKSLG